MERRSVESIVLALNDREVLYLVVGGLAVVAHGYVRFTAAIDLILAMDDVNLTKAVEALASLSYRPRAPVPLAQFADPLQRAHWIEEKGLTVFSLFSPDHPATEIDLFVDPPLPVTEAISRAVRMEVAPGIAATFCSLDDLIELKSRAGRPRDLDDIAQLQKLRKGRS